MDFTSRNQQPNPGVRPSVLADREPTTSGNGKSYNHDKNDRKTKLARIGAIGMLFSLVILVVAVLLYISLVNPSEAKYVRKDDNQAVFLNSGQVYFGHIKSVTPDVLVLQDIFYLQQTNSDQKNSAAQVQLVKLGCELHEPYDQMVINRDQVTFWENLQTGGQVSKLISQYDQKNPNGVTCTDQTQAPANSSNGVQSPSNTSTQGSNTTTQGNTPSSTNSTTTPTGGANNSTQTKPKS